MDKISVIVPVYKVEKYLKKCIYSITGQTYKNIEIILVDDGSPDRCPEICDNLAMADSRIKVIHKENGGLSDARNAGLAIATGDYLMFVDSDDYIEATMTEKLLNLIKRDKSDIALCSMCLIDEKGNPLNEKNEAIPIKNEVLTGGQILNKLTEVQVWAYVVAWNKLYIREIFENISFPLGKLHEDEYTVHHIFGKCSKMSCTDERLYYYVQRDGSIMGSVYTIKNLDAIEALIDRIDYLYKRKMYYAVGVTVEKAIHLLDYARRHLDLKNKENKKHYTDLDKRFKEFCKKNIYLKRCRRAYLKFILYNFSPALYNMVLYFYLKMKK